MNLFHHIAGETQSFGRNVVSGATGVSHFTRLYGTGYVPNPGKGRRNLKLPSCGKSLGLVSEDNDQCISACPSFRFRRFFSCELFVAWVR